MKRIFAMLLCLCMIFAIVACDTKGGNEETTAANGENTTAANGENTTTANGENTTAGGTTENTEAEYKLGMGIVVSTESSAAEKPQVDATVAAVVLDADGKIVACRLDAVQNKATIADGVVTATNLKTKMELGDDYNMAKHGQSMDWNGDGVVKEWYDQAKAFENYVVGKTVAEVEAIETQVVEGSGYVIAKDDALLSAGCTIQITDFVAAVVKACKDEQGTGFKAVADSFTLGVAANSADTSVAATAETTGTVQMFSDFAATVVVDGKIVAALNDAIQPKIAFNLDGTIGETDFGGTKRELKEDYHMAAYGQSMDWNGDGKVLEWYVQSAEFSKYVVGKTAAEVEAMATKVVEGSGYIISAEDALLSAGCTIQITDIKAVVAEAVNNAK